MIKTNKLKHEELTEFSSQYSSEFNTNTDIKTLQNSYQDLHFSRTPKQLLDGIYSSETSIGSVQSSINEPTTIISLTSESSSESYIDDYFSAGRKRTPSEVSESSNSSSFTNDSISKRRRKSIETYEYPISGNIDYSECQAMQSSINDSKFYHQDSRPMHCSVSSNENRKDRYYWNKYGGVLNQKYISKAQSNRLIENKLNRRDLYSKSIYKSIHLPSFSFKEIPKTQKSSLSKQYTMYSKYGSAEKLDCNFVRQEIQPLSPFSNYLNTPISIKTLALNLKPHQVSGVEFLWKTVVEKGHGAILAHAMGLGKTGQVFTFLNTLSYYIRYNRNIISNSLHQFKVLILAPASLQENWINEFQKWTNYEDSSTNSSVYLPIPVSLGETPTRHRIHRLKYWAKNGGILILSHTLFKNCVQNKDYCKKQFEDILVNQPGASLVVIDEAHVLKKENTLIRKISKEFKTPARIMLTGYPMQNNLTEYWCMSKFANDSIFGSLHSFKTEYKYPINKGFYEPLGSRLRKESDRILYKLTKLLQPIVHRVNSDVIKDQIPKKVEYAVCCYLSPIQYTLYTYYMDLFNNELNKAEFLEKGCLLQTICNIPIHKDLIFSSNTGEKVDVFNEDSELEPLGSVHMKVLLDRMKDLSFNSSDIKNNPKFFILTELIQESLLVDEKLIVFSRSIKTLLAIQKWLELFTSQKTLLLTGETAMEDRQYYINCINEDDKYTILLASVSVGGVGFTVTGATRVIIYDLGYNPTVIDQAIARTFRIGQTKNVHVYRLYTFDTWEARLIALSEHKNNLILRTMDSRNSHVNSVNLKEIKRYFKVPEYRFNGERKINGEDYILGKILSKYKDFIASCVIHRDEPTEHRFDIDEAEKRAIEIEVEFAMETIDIFNE
jgi:SNF2 family DNA or RNA helicase